MIGNNFASTKVDQDAERRRVLAKVYGLLIRLADEKVNNNVADTTSVEVPQQETIALADQEVSLPAPQKEK